MSVNEPPIFNTAIFNSEAYHNSSSYATIAFCNKTYLKITGGSIFGSLDIGNNLSLSSVNSHLYIPNNTEASTGINTGSVQSSGGAYFGNSCYINGDLIANSINALNSLEISGAGHLTVSASSHIKINSTSDATAFTNASIYSKGGIYIEKSIIALGTDNQFQSILMNGSINMNFNTLYNASYVWTNNVNTSNLYVSGIFNANYLNLNDSVNSLTITNSSSTGRSNIKCVNDTALSMEFGLRGSTASNPNQVYLYFNGAYKMLMNSTGDTSFLSTTDSNSNTTGCLKLSGGLGVAKSINCANLFVNNTTSHITLNNTSSAQNGFIECSTSPSLLRLVKGYCVNISANGVRIENNSSLEAQKPLDFGSTAADSIISLYGNGQYSFGANDSAIKYISSAHHFWYTGGSATNLIGKLDSSGNFQSTAGIHSTGYASPGNIAGAHIHYGAGTASYFGYDYPNSKWLPTQIGSCCYIYPESSSPGNSSFGGLSINHFGYDAPLYVGGSKLFNRTITSQYGYVATTSVGTSTSTFTNRPVSGYFEAGIIIATNELNVYSDMRKKENIKIIDDSKAFKLLETNAINYTYINEDNSMKAGFSAQELLKMGFTDLVSWTDINNEKLEKETIYCDDGSIIELEEDIKLILNMQAIIPYLHTIIKKQNKRLDEQELEINELKNKLNELID